jgi:hypothetical protein
VFGRGGDAWGWRHGSTAVFGGRGEGALGGGVRVLVGGVVHCCGSGLRFEV